MELIHLFDLPDVGADRRRARKPEQRGGGSSMPREIFALKNLRNRN
jgi:hypothetical protein